MSYRHGSGDNERRGVKHGLKNPDLSRACVRRIGSRVLIDIDAFERWLDQQGANGAVEEGR
jgi:hypothetical protein